MSGSNRSSTSKSSAIIKRWVNIANRVSSVYAKFTVADLKEKTTPDKVILEELSKMMILSRTSRTLLVSGTETLGWSKVKANFGVSIQPSFNNLKKGNFGEVLTSSFAEVFLDYIVPVQKFRYAISKDDSLHGIDNILLRYSEGKINEVCFSESKLRTGTDGNAAVEAYDQLEKELRDEIPSMVKFVAERLIEMRSPMENPFLEYMFDRQKAESKETFLISLIWDIEAWRESALENLEAHTDTMVRTTNVAVVQLSELENLTAMVFEQMDNLGSVDDV